VLEREFREKGSKVIVGSFKPGVVDTAMQGKIRDSSKDDIACCPELSQNEGKYGFCY